MIILAILASLAAISLLCWLLFTLAVFALPAFVGVTVGAWARGTGAGIPGSIVVGAAAAAITLAAGQLLITFARPMWLKLIVAAAFVAPAAIAGYHATHGIVKHLMPSDAWQIAFSAIGAVAIGITAFVRVAGMATAPGPAGKGLARALFPACASALKALSIGSCHVAVHRCNVIGSAGVALRRRC